MSTDTVVVRRGSAEVKIFKATDKYPYYRVCYYTGGKRQVQTFADLGKAKDEAELRANQLSRADGWAAQMDSRDRVIYLDAKTYVDPMEVRLDAAAKEYAEGSGGVRTTHHPSQRSTKPLKGWQAQSGGGSH